MAIFRATRLIGLSMQTFVRTTTTIVIPHTISTPIAIGFQTEVVAVELMVSTVAYLHSKAKDLAGIVRFLPKTPKSEILRPS